MGELPPCFWQVAIARECTVVTRIEHLAGAKWYSGLVRTPPMVTTPNPGDRSLNSDEIGWHRERPWTKAIQDFALRPNECVFDLLHQIAPGHLTILV